MSGQTDAFFSVFDSTRVRLHIFVAPDLHEDVLISVNHMEALSLIPVEWPECMNPKHKLYSDNYTAKTAVEEEAQEEETDSGMESVSPHYEVPPASPGPPPVGIPRTRVNLGEELWSDCGEVHKEFPESMRNILYKYGDVFKTSLSKARKMWTEPIKLELDPDIPIPLPAAKCRAIPIHWQESYDELLDTLIAEGVIVKQEGCHKFCGTKLYGTETS